jgi:hypothetical protein
VITRQSSTGRLVYWGIILILLPAQFACGLIKSAPNKPIVTVTTVPPDAVGGPEKIDLIEGTVAGAPANHKIVIYTFSGGTWYVQPLVNEPFTSIEQDGRWSNRIHLGSKYAALLAPESYKPPARLETLPAADQLAMPMAVSNGRFVAPAKNVSLQFSGYEWEVRTSESNRGGGRNIFSPENAWVDAGGKLHLRIRKEGGQWTCAEVMSKKSFGYGSYGFVLQDTSQLDPNMVITLFTWHKANLSVNDREMDIEISRWGNPKNKNSQYVLQPFYLRDNSARFESPSGLITHVFRWEPNRAMFQSVKGAGIRPIAAAPIFKHTFTAGVPSDEGEPVCMNFYMFRSSPPANGVGAEVVIEKFIFLP